jgi:CubicO group peptidase (beta-lactamase class C family)
MVVMSFRTWGSCLLLMISFPVAPSAQTRQDGLRIAEPEAVGVSSERLGRIRRFIGSYIESNQIAGAVTLVARKGRVVHFQAQGWRNKEDSLPMEKNSLFWLASMTKPIVSTALMMLWEDGIFMLDDPISRWLPGYAEKQVRDSVTRKLIPAVRPITVRHLLTHTSGLAAVSHPDVNSPADSAATLLEAVERAAPLPLAFQPGEQWHYDASTDYVAALVEKMSGKTIDEFIRDRILKPLGMRDTHYNIPRDKVSRVARVYRWRGDSGIAPLGRPEYIRPSKFFPGVTGLSSTATDYFRFAQMLLNGGEYEGQRLLSPMTVKLMISNHIGDDKPVYVRGEGFGFGLGFGVMTDPRKSQDALSTGTFSWGGLHGTLFWVDPVEELVGILMIQITPYVPLRIRPLYPVVVSQAVVESWADRRPKIIGYNTPW